MDTTPSSALALDSGEVGKSVFRLKGRAWVNGNPVDMITIINTPSYTLGIRGTGLYLEAEPEHTYFRTCYGDVEVQATNDPDSKETIVSSHHDKLLLTKSVFELRF